MVLEARVGNGGSLRVSSGVKVSFYRGDPRIGGVLLGTTSTREAIEPGSFEDVSIIWTSPPRGPAEVTASADDDGAGAQGRVKRRGGIGDNVQISSSSQNLSIWVSICCASAGGPKKWMFGESRSSMKTPMRNADRRPS